MQIKKKNHFLIVATGVFLFLVFFASISLCKNEVSTRNEGFINDQVISIVKQDFNSQGFSPSMYRFSAFLFDSSSNNIPLNVLKEIPPEMVGEKNNLWVVYSEALYTRMGHVGGSGCFIIDMDSKRVLIRYRTR